MTAKVPEGELLDENSKESAIGLMELIPLQKTAGFKSTYVRSDKIRSHWQKYKLSEVDKKSGEASFIKYETKEVTGIDADGNETKKSVRSGKIDAVELKKQLKEASVSLKFESVPTQTLVIPAAADNPQELALGFDNELCLSSSIYLSG